MMRFKNRIEAGRLLAERLSTYANRPDTLTLGLPRGGAPVAYEVATALKTPFDVFIVRKLGVPVHQELAMGAIASGEVISLNYDVIEYLRIPNEVVEEVTEREKWELERLERLYRDDRPALSPRDRVTILVDDGLATGSTMRAAVIAVRKQQPKSIIVAVPVAAAQTIDDLRVEADDVVCLYSPEPFYAVGLWYEDFSQTSDEEVRNLLAKAENRLAGAANK